MIQQAEGKGHVVASLSLGPPCVPLIFLGQEPAAAQANTAQPRWDPGFIQDNKPVSSDAGAFSSLNLGASPISDETRRKAKACIQATDHQPAVIGPSRDNEAHAATPHIDHNAIAIVNKLRSDFAVTLTLISDGDFVAQLQSKDVPADPVHNHGEGEIRNNAIATIHSEPEWHTYSQQASIRAWR